MNVERKVLRHYDDEMIGPVAKRWFKARPKTRRWWKNLYRRQLRRMFKRELLQ